MPTRKKLSIYVKYLLKRSLQLKSNQGGKQGAQGIYVMLLGLYNWLSGQAIQKKDLLAGLLVNRNVFGKGDKDIKKDSEC